MPIRKSRKKAKLTKSQKIQLDVFRKERARLNREIRKSKIELKKARKLRGLPRKKKRS